MSEKPPTLAEDVAMLRKALRCLRLEVAGEIMNDVDVKAAPVMAAAERAEKAEAELDRACECRDTEPGDPTIICAYHLAIEVSRDKALAERDAMRERAEKAERELERARGAIEVLVSDEIISAGRARELHGMTIEEQRAHWRARLDVHPRAAEPVRYCHVADLPSAEDVARAVLAMPLRVQELVREELGEEGARELIAAGAARIREDRQAVLEVAARLADADAIRSRASGVIASGAGREGVASHRESDAETAERIAAATRALYKMEGE